MLDVLVANLLIAIYLQKDHKDVDEDISMLAVTSYFILSILFSLTAILQYIQYIATQ